MGYNSGQFHHRGKLNEADKTACISARLLIEYSGKVPNSGEKTYSPFAKDCIIFPLKNKKNEIVSLYGRSILSVTKSKHYYLKNRTGLYPGYPNAETEVLIITESIIDAETLIQLGITNLVLGIENVSFLASYGVNGFTKEHTEAVSQLTKLKEIIFFFDGDKAGESAVKKYAEELKEFTKVKISQVQTLENEDINSLLDGHGNEIFTHLINERTGAAENNVQ